jgi:hypothetical protein
MGQDDISFDGLEAEEYSFKNEIIEVDLLGIVCFSFLRWYSVYIWHLVL